MDRKGVGSLRTSENDILIQVIKEARLAAGISQEELSRRMGQSITFIVKIERGTRRLDVYEFVRLSEAIGLQAADLFASYVGCLADRNHLSRT